MSKCRICGKETIHPRMGMGPLCAKKFGQGILPSLKAKGIPAIDIPVIKLDTLEKFTSLEVIGDELEEVGLSPNNLGEYVTTLCIDEEEKGEMSTARQSLAVFNMLKENGIIPKDSTMAGVSRNLHNNFNLGILAFYPHEDPRPDDDMVFINLYDFGLDIDDKGEVETFIPFFREYGIITSKNIMFIHNGSYIGNYYLGKNNYFFNNNDTSSLEATVKKVKERNMGDVDHSRNPFYYFEEQEEVDKLRSKVAGFVFFRNFVRLHSKTMATLQEKLEKANLKDKDAKLDLSYSNITLMRQVYIQHVFKKKEDGISPIEIEAIQRSFEMPILQACFSKEEIDLVHDYLESSGGESFYYDLMKTGSK